jgi:hypothetical protein
MPEPLSLVALVTVKFGPPDPPPARYQTVDPLA